VSLSPLVLLPSAKSIFSSRSKNLRPVFLLLVVLVAMGSVGIAVSQQGYGQQTNGRLIVFPVTIQWNKQKNVARYRLQIAADEKFQDVFFDGRVAGNRYVVKDLLPGAYYWRVAPADSQLGAFSPPLRFFLSGGVVTTVELPHRLSGSR
jgi:hypothetical protein